MNTMTYLVTVSPLSWDGHQKAFISGYCQPVESRLYDNLASALAAFSRHVGDAENWARYERAPVQVEVMQRADETCDWEPLEINGPDGKPFDACHYYGGRNCKGLRVLWAHNMHGSNGGPKYRRSELLGYVDGRHGQPTGEWELRHVDDRAGALYADEIFDTDEQARAYFEEHDELVELLHEVDRKSLGL